MFTGTVLSVEREGRIAQVKTDDGHNVVVRGTPSDSGTGFTTVDRTYTVGARHEFHPRNATSPYEDNACTATRQIGATTGAAGAGGGASPNTGTNAGGPVLALLALAAFVAVAEVVGARMIRRRRAVSVVDRSVAYRG